MKPFWISSIILTSMIALTLYNTQHLKEVIQPLEGQLIQAADYAKAEDWDRALQLTQKVHNAWEGHKTYLHVTLPHSNIDQIYMLLEEALAYLEYKEIGEYLAANKNLISQMDMLYDMESLTLTNIL
jgi:hypothetical protein